MALKTPLPTPVAYTIEFVGIGQVGLKRLISKFEYLSQGSLRRVNIVAPPVQGWLDLIQEWTFDYHPVSLSIRHGNDVLLTLNNAFPLYLHFQLIDAFSQLPMALVSFGSPQVVFSRIQPVVSSALDQHMPASVRQGIRLKRVG
jgi:hypothetical protein